MWHYKEVLERLSKGLLASLAHFSLCLGKGQCWVRPVPMPPGQPSAARLALPACGPCALLLSSEPQWPPESITPVHLRSLAKHQGPQDSGWHEGGADTH